MMNEVNDGGVAPEVLEGARSALKVRGFCQNSGAFQRQTAIANGVLRLSFRSFGRFK